MRWIKDENCSARSRWHECIICTILWMEIHVCNICVDNRPCACSFNFSPVLSLHMTSFPNPNRLSHFYLFSFFLASSVCDASAIFFCWARASCYCDAFTARHSFASPAKLSLSKGTVAKGIERVAAMWRSKFPFLTSRIKIVCQFSTWFVRDQISANCNISGDCLACNTSLFRNITLHSFRQS